MIRIVRADGSAERALLDTLRARSGEVDKQVTAAVTEIIEAVRDCGDETARARIRLRWAVTKSTMR